MYGVVMTTLALSVAAAPAPRGQNYQIDGLTFSSGGTMTTSSAEFELSVTIGEPVVGTTAGPNYELTMGFWALATIESPVDGDFDGDGDVDLVDFANFALCFNGTGNPPAASCPPGIDADFDNDGDVDLVDFATFSLNFTGAL